MKHNGILFSHKKEEILPFEIKTWMDLEDIMQSEISWQIPYDLTCIRSDFWLQRQGLGIGKWGEGIKRYKLPVTKEIKLK